MPRINVHKCFGTASYLFRHSTPHYDCLTRQCYLRLEAHRLFHRCLSPSPMTTNAQTPAKCAAIELAIFLSITDLVPSTFQFSPPILRLMLYAQFMPQFMPQGSAMAKTKCTANVNKTIAVISHDLPSQVMTRSLLKTGRSSQHLGAFKFAVSCTETQS